MTSKPLKPLKPTKLDLQNLPEINHICAAYPKLNWNSAKLKETLARPDTVSMGLWQDKQLLSFILISVISNEAELLVLATLPEYCNQGYAGELLQQAQRMLLERGITQLFLEVRASNTQAISLYQAQGFKTINIRKAYYTNATGPKEDARIMELSL